MRYFVTIGDRTVEVDLSGPTPRIDGQAVDARISGMPGSFIRHLEVDDAAHTLVAEPAAAGRGTWRVTAGGRTLSAEVVDERTRAIREMGGGHEADARMVMLAPMPGLVVRIAAEVGQAVAAGDGLIVVEAMKMENELKAPADGVVARIEVAAGQAVEKGATLIVLE